MDLERPRRVNGLSRPFTPAQVSTWVFLPCLVLEFLLFCSPVLPVAASVPLTLVFAGLAASSSYFGYVAMTIDPADPRIDRGSTGNSANTESSANAGSNGDSEEDTKHCWLCDCRVHNLSMHCRYCNKCVDHFDHHCMWLNTCVGKANYQFFYRTMVSITAMLVIHGTVQLGLIVDIFVRNDGVKLRTEDWLGADATIPIVVVLLIFLVFDLSAFSLMSQLLAFHIKLQREGLTTYAFVVGDNQRRREKTKLDSEIESKRVLEMEKAKNEGRSCYHFQLRSAGWALKTYGVQVAWDPLRGQQQKDEKLQEGSPPTDSITVKEDPGTNSSKGNEPTRGKDPLSPDKREILQAATDMESFEAIRAAQSVLHK